MEPARTAFHHFFFRGNLWVATMAPALSADCFGVSKLHIRECLSPRFKEDSALCFYGRKNLNYIGSLGQ